MNKTGQWQVLASPLVVAFIIGVISFFGFQLWLNNAVSAISSNPLWLIGGIVVAVFVWKIIT